VDSRRLLGLLFALVLSSVAGCGGATAPPAAEPVPAEPSRPTGPIQALVDIALDALALESALERGTYDQSESWLVVQRRGHAGDARAARLLDQLDVVADGLEAPRCHWNTARIRATRLPTADTPVAEGSPQLYGMATLHPTRASLVEELARSMLGGLDRPEAVCGSARVAEVRAWLPVLAALERRDGIEAALSADPGRRAQVERLLAIDEGYAAAAFRSDDSGPEAARALADEAVPILETWTPQPTGLEALRSYDLDHPIADENRREPGTPLRELQALLRWAIRGAIADAMPAVENSSAESRALRAYLDALRDDPEAAIRLGAALPEDLAPDSDGRDRADPAWVADACGDQPPAPPPEDDFEGDDYDLGPSVYSCTGTYTGEELASLAERYAENGEELFSSAMSYRRSGEERAPPRGELTRYLFEQACEAGDGPSCAMFGWILAEGPEAQRDEARARVVLRTACEMREHGASLNPGACGRLGALLRAGRGGARALSEAWGLIDQACRQRQADACTEAVRMLRAGEVTLPGSERDATVRRACEHGSGLACTEQGLSLLTSSPDDAVVEPALDSLVRACNVHGHREACEHLVRVSLHWPEWTRLVALFGGNLCYRDGSERWCGWWSYRSDAHDRVEGAERGCEAGSPDGCAAAALIRGGAGATRAVTSACDEGSSLACYVLGERARRRDPARARELFRRACDDDDGLAMGCAELAELLDSRRGGRPDRAAAAAARARACERGHHPGTCAAVEAPRP